MTGHRQPQRNGEVARGAGLRRIGACMLAFAVMLTGVAPAALAQQEWMATVATSPGGTLNAPIASSVNRAPTKIDPRLFPSPRTTVVRPRTAAPQGTWSPIVTGALPEPGQAPGVEGQEFRGIPAPDVPQFEALSPVRRVRQLAASEGKADAAKAGASKAGASKADAAKAGASKAGASKADAAEPVASDGGEGEDPIFRPLTPLDPPPPTATAAQQYCFNTSDSAQDARFAWQAKKIKEMEADLDKRAQQLEAKTEAYKHWLERRDEFSRKAHEKLVSFYARMRPDAAALQLATVNEETAAAVMMKLETKVASQILGEMDPERAAKIATIISGSSRVSADRRSAPARSAEGAPAGEAATPASSTPPPAAGPKT